MAISVNAVILAGNLTADPEMQETASGKTKAKFTIAHNRSWKGKDGEKKEATSFIDCEAWSHAANFVGKYCKKGQLVCVEGTLEQSRWEDKPSGQKRSRLFVQVWKITADKGEPRAIGQEKEPAHDAPAQPAPPSATDDLPF